MPREYLEQIVAALNNSEPFCDISVPSQLSSDGGTPSTSRSPSGTLGERRAATRQLRDMDDRVADLEPRSKPMALASIRSFTFNSRTYFKVVQLRPKRSAAPKCRPAGDTYSRSRSPRGTLGERRTATTQLREIEDRVADLEPVIEACGPGFDLAFQLRSLAGWH
ncbi:MAG: hypothetical protein JWM11_792 [Planctomycetaceae bacterium]|nr:hypothetical protein [Planctomycetaceae bacterium]